MSIINTIGKRVASVVRFYVEGFREMPQWAVKVWIIIAVKLAIIFLILKLIFFPGFLKSKFETDEERADYVIEQITR